MVYNLRDFCIPLTVLPFFSLFSQQHGDGSITSDTRQQIPQEQQQEQRTGPVPSGVAVRPWRADRRILIRPPPLWHREQAYLTKTFLKLFHGKNSAKRNVKAYPFWQNSRDICWCLRPLLHGRACQHLKHPPGWFYQSLPTHRTPASTNIKCVKLVEYSIIKKLFMNKTIADSLWMNTWTNQRIIINHTLMKFNTAIV